ncbi:MAG: DUF342 domain-containing protein [Sedimentisphaerales bacterium]|nr:DUF342 domain-containing protein [Sedimentisphaerales bacterium]
MPVTESKLFRIQISHDRLTATLSVNGDSLPPACTAGKIEAEIQPFKLFLNEEGRANIIAFAAKLAEHAMPQPMVIAQGDPPVHDENGQIELLYKTSQGDAATGEAQEDSPQSFYERSNIQRVRAGQPLLRLIPPREGQDGRDIFGKPIARKRGRQAQLSLGANVRLEDDVVYATANGKLEYSGERVSVSDVLEIAGNVDFSIGNIDFDGSVIVARNVLDLFKIRSHASVTVRGIIEAAEVQAEGDLTCQGGMTGKEKGLFIAGGTIETKYITNATVRAGKDVVVRMEVVNCDLICRGALRIESGLLVGGRTVATGGLRVRTLGSEACVNTPVEVGIDDNLRQTYLRVAPEIEQLRRKAEKVRQIVEPLLRNQKALNAEQKEKATELLYNSYDLEDRAEQKIEQLRSVQEESRQYCLEEVVVLGEVYPGVTFRFPRLEGIIESPLKGPIKFIPRKVEGVYQIVAVDCLSGSCFSIHSGPTSDTWLQAAEALLSGKS